MAATPKLGKTDQLIADLLANNGRIPVPDREQDRFERLARTAVRRGKVPAGKEIHVQGRWDTGYHLVLIDEPAWKSVILAPVPVQEALRKPSDVVVQLRDHRVVLVSHDVLNRALRLLDALVQESRRRGYQVVTWSRPPRLAYESIGTLDGSHLNIEIGHDKYGLSIHQERDKVEHVATKTELARAERGYSYIPKHDEVKTERLRITIDGQDVAFWRNQWSDREPGPLEEWLAQILQELELRHERAEERRAEEKRQREEKQRQWDAVRASAVEQLQQAHRGKVLRDQTERWELVARIRAYIDAVRIHLGTVQDQEQRDEALRWIEWANAYAAEIDPLTLPLGMPTDPKPTGEALEPFMQGWSPYRPY